MNRKITRLAIRTGRGKVDLRVYGHNGRGSLGLLGHAVVIADSVKEAQVQDAIGQLLDGQARKPLPF